MRPIRSPARKAWVPPPLALAIGLLAGPAVAAPPVPSAGPPPARPAAASPLLPAADWRNPYGNVDRRYDAGNDTGDHETARLNDMQLRGGYAPGPPPPPNKKPPPPPPPQNTHQQTKPPTGPPPHPRPATIPRRPRHPATASPATARPTGPRRPIPRRPIHRRAGRRATEIRSEGQPGEVPSGRDPPAGTRDSPTRFNVFRHTHRVPGDTTASLLHAGGRTL